MDAENDTSNRIWPATGIWGASYRIMFPLTAIWAIFSVTIWVVPFALMSVPNPMNWHIHEMVIGLGSAALLGYLPSAISSWTGRAPVTGWPVKAMAGLWISARLAMYFASYLPDWCVAVVNAAVFWSCAAVLISEALMGAVAKIWAYIAFLLIAGCVAGVSSAPDFGEPLLVIWLFVSLLTVVGTRMGYGFLQSQAQRNGETVKPDQRWLTWIAVFAPLLLIVAFFELADGVVMARLVFLIGAMCLTIQCANWPLKWAKGQGLIIMTCVGVFWVPIGLWAVVLELFDLSPPSFSSTTHAPIMGALSSLIMAVMARPHARRTEAGLTTGPGVFAAFLFLQIAIFCRLADAVMISFWVWVLAWGMFLVTVWPRIDAPIPRPIFSGTRQKRATIQSDH
ncbi:NnrS family protein [uncultured Pelagimonas sp.]|uniref:NnrS family protein n=1 Tax=uncultured Pelagimonas sp. TaxID=1618102 RepID=UPI00261B87F5|nr:NnrS family protein [uncultured Pelagimonas sp.]